MSTSSLSERVMGIAKEFFEYLWTETGFISSANKRFEQELATRIEQLFTDQSQGLKAAVARERERAERLREALLEISRQPDVHPLATWSHDRARKALAAELMTMSQANEKLKELGISYSPAADAKLDEGEG